MKTVKNSYSETLFTRSTWCNQQASHDRKFCPASNATFDKCGKKGNFQAFCRTSTPQAKRAGEIEEEAQFENIFFLGL